MPEPSSTQVVRTAEEGAHSIFHYIARTAEPVEHGVRWQTMDYESKPHYGAGLFNGWGGVPIFLAEYHRQFGDPQALDLAIAGVRRLVFVAQAQPIEATHADDWFYFSRPAGAAVASLLSVARATGDPTFLRDARRLMDRLPPVDAHGTLDFIGGTAGEGVLCLRVWKEAGDEKFFDLALERADRLAREAIRLDTGTVWPLSRKNPDRVGTGFAHGTAGIVHFLLLMHRYTRDPQWRILAQDALRWLDSAAVPDSGGLNWRNFPESPGNLSCQWCWGSPGLGLLYAKAYEILGDTRYLDTAKAAGETTYAYADNRHNPSLCHGLAGNAQLFLELYRLTDDTLWLDRAHDFAHLCLAYRTTSPEGDTWQGDEPGYPSPDFWCGAAGTGHFFLRLRAPHDVPTPLH